MLSRPRTSRGPFVSQKSKTLNDNHQKIMNIEIYKKIIISFDQQDTENSFIDIHKSPDLRTSHKT